MKGVGYGKENICAGLFVDIAVVALFSYRDYRHLFFHRSESAGQLDRFLYQTLYFAFHYGHASFFDECID